jgi:hypothetical protein
MNLKYLLAATLAIAVATPVLAADDPQASEAPKEKKICRTERTTGSLVAQRRICMTRAEWDKLAAETKRDVEDIQRNAGSIPRTAGPNGAGAASQ